VRVVIALGGNALLRRGEEMTLQNQRANVRTACEAIAPVALAHELLVSHGNGPQVGLLALKEAAYEQFLPGYPLDVLDAETQGMIGYLIERELGNLLPEQLPLATLLTMIEVDPDDPALCLPTKPVGPVYDRATADRLAEERGWAFAADGDGVRRVVPSPQPRRIFQLRQIRWLLERGCVVICAGGGGIPTTFTGPKELDGVEAVIDKDLASALLASQVDAEVLVLATDVDGVYLDWGGPAQARVRRASPSWLRERADDFAAGSIGPKVEAAARFVVAGGRRAVIGGLGDIARMVEGTAGTSIEADAVLEMAAPDAGQGMFGDGRPGNDPA